jgi:hypothetical protein
MCAALISRLDRFYCLARRKTERNIVTAKLDEKTGEELTLTERSKVPLTMVGALFGFLVVLISAAWFLATSLSQIQSKLDAVTLLLGSVSTKTTTIEVRQSEHEREDIKNWTVMDGRLSVIEKSGSEKTREIERELNTLRNDVRVHERITSPPPK